MQLDRYRTDFRRDSMCISCGEWRHRTSTNELLHIPTLFSDEIETILDTGNYILLTPSHWLGLHVDNMWVQIAYNNLTRCLPKNEYKLLNLTNILLSIFFCIILFHFQSKTTASWRPVRHIPQELLAGVLLTVHRHARGWGAGGHRNDHPRAVSVFRRSVHHAKHQHPAVLERVPPLPGERSAGQDRLLDAEARRRPHPDHLWPAHVQRRFALLPGVRGAQWLEATDPVRQRAGRGPLRVPGVLASAARPARLPDDNW